VNQKRKSECHPDAIYYSRGMCRACYDKWHRSANPECYRRKARNRKPSSKPAACHPNRPHQAKGLCHQCYVKMWYETVSKPNGLGKKARAEDLGVYLMNTAKYRAKKDGLPFDLVAEDVIIPSTCPVLGIPLAISSGSIGDNSPTIDRIYPEKGYVKGNILVVSWRVNRVKGHATPDELVKIAAFYSERWSRETSAVKEEK
jgi:hypothetical protein